MECWNHTSRSFRILFKVLIIRATSHPFYIWQVQFILVTSFQIGADSHRWCPASKHSAVRTIVAPVMLRFKIFRFWTSAFQYRVDLQEDTTLRSNMLPPSSGLKYEESFRLYRNVMQGRWPRNTECSFVTSASAYKTVSRPAAPESEWSPPWKPQQSLQLQILCGNGA
jgi:hypothetical protein